MENGSHAINRVRPVLLLITLIAIVFTFFGDPTSVSADLGVGIDILPTSDATPGALSANRELWFAVSPGGSATRALRVLSSSDQPQRVSLRLYPLVVSDGEARIDTSTPSETANWATISPNDFVLNPRGTQEVSFQYTIPRDVQPAIYESFLQIGVSGVKTGSETTLPGTKAVIPTALSFEKAVWLGVGSGDFLKSDFEIDGIAGIRHDGKNWLQVQLRNTGQTPIRPKGEVEVVDPLFSQRRFDPVNFSSPTIDPGKTSRTEFEAPLGMTDGDWKILVTARQGSIEKTVIYEQNISFDNSTSEFFGLWRRIFQLPWLRWLFVLIALGGIGVGWRMMRGGGERRPPDEPQKESSDEPQPDDEPPSRVPQPMEPEGNSNSDLAPRNLSDQLEVRRIDSDAILENPAVQDEKLVPDEGPSTQWDGASSNDRIVVHVAGAVKSPGMYEVDEDSRVGEVIELAGGAWVLADLASINLARRVIDGEQIVVPTRTASGSPRISTPPGLNLNRATEEQLSEVPGIGVELAREIIALRKRVVRFTDITQLLEVRGIGPKKLEALRKNLFV